MNNLITIPFHNQTITAIESDGNHYIAMRPIVENLGLKWAAQSVKINQRFNSSVSIIETVGESGKKRKFLCLPLTKLAAFLYSINASKVKPELRKTIIVYQEKCDEVLDDYFRNQQKFDSRYYQNKYTTLRQAVFKAHPLWDAVATYRCVGHTHKRIGQLIHRHPSTVSRMLKQITAHGIDCQPSQSLAA